MSIFFLSLLKSKNLTNNTNNSANVSVSKENSCIFFIMECEKEGEKGDMRAETGRPIH
jgi:hypothetical protein